jgi:hypothetical protein
MNNICFQIKLPFQGVEMFGWHSIPKALPLGRNKLGFQPVFMDVL